MPKIQFRRDLAANWTAANPTLASGEPAYETDTGKQKMGDGVTAWASLPYLATSAASLSAYTTKASLPLNPLDYGAVGDGTTDDTVALSTLLNGLTAGQTVDLGGRTYKVTNLSISGRSRFRVLGRGARILTSSVLVSSLQISSCTDFTIDGLSIIGSATNRNNQPNRGISIEGCSRFTISNNEVTAVSSIGILVKQISTGNFDGVISGNTVHDNYADGIGLYGFCKRVSVANNIIRDTGDDTIAVLAFAADADWTEDISIAGNVSQHSGSRGIAVAGARNVSIAGNTIRDSRYGGILVTWDSANGTKGCQDVAITGNAVYGANTLSPAAGTNYAGIQVNSGSGSNPVTGVTVTGNTVEGSGWHGILIGSSAAGTSEVVCSSNVIRNSGSAGLIAQTVQDLIVNGNLIDTAVGTGLWLSGATGSLTVVGNSVRNPNTATANGYGYRLNCAAVTQGIAALNTYSDTGSNTTTPFTTTGAWTTIANNGAALSAASAADVQVFTTSGTWTKPGVGTLTQVIAIGAGSGGGSGRVGAAATVRSGGSGGAGGGVSRMVVTTASLPGSVPVVVQAAGTGGASIATSDTNGAGGVSGGGTTFGSYLRAGGGSSAAAGGTGAGASAAAGTGNYTGGVGGAAAIGAAGGAGGSSNGGAGGGGAGGGISAGDVAAAGGAGGSALSASSSIPAAGAVGAAGSAGTDQPIGSALPGAGSGGGGASITANGGAGANGARYGAGGGGGGAALNGFASGKGGDGGPAIVLAITS